MHYRKITFNIFYHKKIDKLKIKIIKYLIRIKRHLSKCYSKMENDKITIIIKFNPKY